MSAGPAALPDTCPRCGGGFACGMNGAAPCPCTAFTLDAPTLAELRQRYDGCLCTGCLRQVAQAALPAQAALQNPPLST